MEEKINYLTKRIEALEETIKKLTPISKTKKDNSSGDNYYTTDELQKYFNGSPFVAPEDLKPNILTFAGHYVSPNGSVKSRFGACISKINGNLNQERYPASEISKIINAYANEERILILRELLKKSMPAKELMQILKFKTTGKLYHHLSYLENIGIVYKKDEIYHIQGYAIGCSLMIFDCATRLIRRFEENN